MNNLTGSAGVHPYKSQGTRSVSHPPEPQKEWNYEMTVQKIEAAIAKIESGNLELADVFDQFAEAVEQLRQCETFLTERQEQIDLLIETLSDEPNY